MKASFRLILAALAAAVALTACTKEITPNFENDKVNPEGSRVIAVSFGPQTKTRLDGLQPKFNDGDSIFLCTKADKQEDIVTDIRRVTVDDCGNATITTELTGELVAWYPARAVTYDDYTGGYNILNTPVQSGSFADANICSAAIDETAKKATFENEYALFIVTPPDGAQSLTIKSLRVMGESGGQRTGSRKSINVSTINDSAYFVTVPTPPKDEGKYYVALQGNVYMSNLSFEVEFEKEGTGSIKGIPLSRIEENADALGESANRYNFIDAGTAYTIDDKNWHEYVEVGGHKWATMNVGADAPEEFGDYFMWGEVYGHKYVSATWTNFPDNKPADSRYPDTWTSGAGFANYNAPYYDGSDYSGSKYSTTGKIVLDLADDVANANWGGAWRMPTKEEFDALLIETSSWDDTNAGYSFGESSNKIFLPTVGYGAGVGPEKDGDGGNYWSSSLDTNRPDFAWYLYFDVNGAGTASNGRCYGQPIRAIIDDGASAPAPESTADDFNVKEDDTSNWQ